MQPQESIMELAVKTHAFQSFMLEATPSSMKVMGNLIEVSFTLEWTTDHETIMSEMQAMGEITMQQKDELRETYAMIAHELPDYHSQ
jgi:hypothetical protein